MRLLIVLHGNNASMIASPARLPILAGSLTSILRMGQWLLGRFDVRRWIWITACMVFSAQSGRAGKSHIWPHLVAEDYLRRGFSYFVLAHVPVGKEMKATEPLVYRFRTERIYYTHSNDYGSQPGFFFEKFTADEITDHFEANPGSPLAPGEP
jgi:hypothetical protein